MKAHPDIKVMRGIVGDMHVLQALPDKWRHLTVDVAHEEGSQRHYPTTILSAWEAPPRTRDTEYLGLHIRRHGLTTIVRVHTEDDEQVTPEVGYDERLPYPIEYTLPRIRWIEQYAQPIPAQELIATARIGLDMLKAYQEANRDQQQRIDNTLSGFDGVEQLVDCSRPDADAYIALASPALGEFIRQEGISYDHVNTKEIYALNALNNVTDTMLPQEMPQVPPNRRERIRRPVR
jgi:hypothetical protein